LQNLKVTAPLRVLLLELPHLLRDILEQAIRQQADCELLKDIRELEVLMGQTMPPDVVVLGLTEEQDAALVATLLARWPMTQVVTVTQGGDDAMAYELRPHRRTLGQVSAADIVRTLRQVVHESRALWM
jgi:DNA-binding NarL/FixJ family response regulator